MSKVVSIRSCGLLLLPSLLFFFLVEDEGEDGERGKSGPRRVEHEDTFEVEVEVERERRETQTHTSAIRSFRIESVIARALSRAVESRIACDWFVSTDASRVIVFTDGSVEILAVA